MARYKIELIQTKQGIIFSVYDGGNLSFEILDKYKLLGINRAKEIAAQREAYSFFENLPESLIKEKINELKEKQEDEFTLKAIEFLSCFCSEENKIVEIGDSNE
jgi:hypothetical protein